MSRKIIIHIENDIPEGDATHYVLQVIHGGRVSEERGLKTFCFATSWKNGVVVTCRPSSPTTDTFRVYKGTNSPEKS